MTNSARTQLQDVLKDAHILIMDDEKDVGMMHRYMLVRSGFREVNTVQSYQELLEHLIASEETHPVDLLLLDISMPQINGIQICHQLRKLNEYNHLPIIMLTASKEEDDLIRAFESGANDYIKKPVTLVEMEARIKVALRAKREQEKQQEMEEQLLKLSRELVNERSKLQRLIYFDDLTQVHNRRAFHQRLESLWNLAQKEKKGLGALILDVDDFKKYNDTYGHLAGDECLKQVATSMRKTLKDYFVARYGGEEFVALLNVTEPDSLKDLAFQVCEDIVDLKIPHEKSSTGPYVSASIGGAIMLPTERKGPSSQLISWADQALYMAKAHGRNQAKILDHRKPASQFF